jgi:hypothetical protein
MSSRKRARTDDAGASDDSESGAEAGEWHETLKPVRGDDIAAVLKSAGYDLSPFSPKRVHKLKTFTSSLLAELHQTWSQFKVTSPAILSAALKVGNFGPPQGAIKYFDSKPEKDESMVRVGRTFITLFMDAIHQDDKPETGKETEQKGAVRDFRIPL